MRLFYGLLVFVFYSAYSQTVYATEAKNTEDANPGRLQYQFLIGEWDIKVSKYYVPAGGLKEDRTARQKVEYKDNGKMIVDQWTGFDALTKKQDFYGITLRTYSEETQRWQNVFLGSNQKVDSSSFISEWKNNEMHGAGQYEVEGLGTIKYKLKFFNITKNSYEWEEMLSKDDGKNWFLSLRQVATRRVSH